MDKELVVLQKQINLHVADIERYQGFVSRLAITKGRTVEELRRNKEKARKTMKQLKEARTTNAGVAGQSTLAQAGGQSIGLTQSNNRLGANSSMAFVEGSPVDILLFGFKRGGGAFSTSFNASQGSDNSS